MIESSLVAGKPLVRFIIRKEINIQNKIARFVSGQIARKTSNGINPIKAERLLSGSISRVIAQHKKNENPKDTPCKIILKKSN